MHKPRVSKIGRRLLYGLTSCMWIMSITTPLCVGVNYFVSPPNNNSSPSLERVFPLIVQHVTSFLSTLVVTASANIFALIYILRKNELNAEFVGIQKKIKRAMITVLLCFLSATCLQVDMQACVHGKAKIYAIYARVQNTPTMFLA